MSFPQNFPASAAAGMGDIESSPINSDQASFKRIPGLHFMVGTDSRIIARPGTLQLKPLTQVYSSGNATRDVSKLIARRVAEILEDYFKVIATAANGSNALVAAAWIPALRILTKEKRWAEYPGVTNQQVQSVMDAFGDARKRFVDGHLANDASCKAQPNREHFKNFVDLLDRFNTARGDFGGSSPVSAAADKVIRDAFQALQIDDQQNDQINQDLQTSAAQIQAAISKKIQNAFDALKIKDKVIETMSQQRDQLNKAVQMAQDEITAARAETEKAKKQHEKTKNERGKMEKENRRLKAKNLAASTTAVVAAVSDHIVGFAAEAVIETEAAEQRAGISGPGDVVQPHCR
ncbi:hypothetical protein CSAL01_04677 [Colletotrichum salicis]|uniref:Uncharacterized protein n=1 Tax=Colletotrichum salicis TaxID=1209931 RepID=A0A135UW01_9PEZI|nr:hypothetical protein CSAL01_04677 [Colletotrichum salicis]